MMKKVIVLLFSLIVLVGCSDGYAKISDDSTVLFKVGSEEITKGDVYASMFSNAGAYATINDATQTVVDIEIPVTDEMKSEAQSTMDTMANMYGEMFEQVLQSNGYKDADDYLNKGLIPSLQAKELYTKYVEDNWATYVTEKNPKKAIVLEFSDLDKANEAVGKLNEGSSIEDVVKEYGVASNPSEQIVLADAKYPTEVMTALNGEASGEFTALSTTDGKVYVFKLTNSDAESFKEEVVSQLITKEEVQADTVEFYIKKYGLEVYDRNLYDMIEMSHPEYLK